MAQLEVVAPDAAISERRPAGRATRLLFHLAWLLPCLLVISWFQTTQSGRLQLVDALDAAQVGRHLSRGDGFVTSFVRPLSLALAPRVAGHPDLQNAPVFPLLLGTAFNLAGATDRTAARVSSLFALLAAIMAYLLGQRLANPRAGGLAALLVALNLGLLTAAAAGSSIPVLAFLVALLFYLLLIHRGTRRWSLLCGAVCGATYLTDYAALLVALPAAALAAHARGSARLRHLVLFAAGFLILVSPWLARNWAVAGSPFAGLRTYAVAGSGSTNPALTVYRLSSAEGMSPVRFAVSHPREILKKFLTGLNASLASVMGLLGPVLLAVLALALFVDLGPTGNRLKWGVMSGGALMGVSLAAGSLRFDSLYGLVSVAAGLGAAAFAAIGEQRARPRRATLAAVGAILVCAGYPVALTALPGSRPPKPDHRNFEYLGRALPPTAVVVTDLPWSVAWYADRTAIWLPEAQTPSPPGGGKGLTVEQAQAWAEEAADVTRAKGFAALAKSGAMPNAIFLSSGLRAYSQGERLGRWQWLQNVIDQQVRAAQQTGKARPIWVPPGWELAATLPPEDFLLLRGSGASVPDRKRADRQKGR